MARVRFHTVREKRLRWTLWFCLDLGTFQEAYVDRHTLLLLCFRYCDFAFDFVGLFFFCFIFFTNWRFVGTRHLVSLLVPFPNSICSLCISVTHFCNSHNIPKIFIIIFVMVICDQWSLLIVGHGLHRPGPGVWSRREGRRGPKSLVKQEYFICRN